MSREKRQSRCGQFPVGDVSGVHDPGQHVPEWERDSIRDRFQAGVDRAAAEGRTGGRPPVLDLEKAQAIRDFLANNNGNVSAAHRIFRVSRGTIRAVRDGTYAGLEEPGQESE